MAPSWNLSIDSGLKRDYSPVLEVFLIPKPENYEALLKDPYSTYNDRFWLNNPYELLDLCDIFDGVWF